MNDTYQVLKLTVQPCLTIEKQQRFWKRLHHYLLQHQRWWNVAYQTFWIDIIYQGEHPLTVYITVPKHVLEHLPHFLRGNERRGRKNSSIQFTGSEQEALKVAAGSAVCELKLAYENLFALSSSASIALPETLPLTETETARLSFGLLPTNQMSNNIRKNETYRAKMESGIRETRAHVDSTGLFKLLLFYLDYWTQRLFVRDAKATSDVPWLSSDTIRKINDCHYKAYIRIAGPQRILPKLAKPFSEVKGDNELKIQFLPKGEQHASLKELNRQHIGIYSRSDLNPNILGSRELSAILPFIISSPKEQLETCPNFK